MSQSQKTNKTYSMDKNIVEKIEQTEKETGLKKSTIVNKALKQYFEKK